ncbi:MAG: universal stress protein [Emcibacter sp.]|nr:universal stress protein [Emcibacter sp.]MBL4894519.1 universal stress protein [Emcibacter sp.]
MSDEKKAFNNVLVVIDPAKDMQYALKRALKMNELMDGGVEIHLFISFEMDELRKSNDKFQFYCDNNWFAELVRPLVKNNITYTAEVFWTADWHHSILASVERHNIDMVVMSDHKTANSRNDMSAAKWALLRVSPCPVLIVHPEAQAQRKRILAAVNMQTDNPRYVELNEKILKRAQQMAIAYGAEKHVVNAYEDSTEFPDRAKLLRDTDTKQENTHVHQGAPADIITKVADDIEADIVVIGTLSRRGIMAAMRGNKSEEIIRKLNRDVMVLN